MKRLILGLVVVLVLVGGNLVLAEGIYWTDSSAGFPGISRANLDGTQVEVLISPEPTHPFGIALDIAGGNLYWSEIGGQTIKRAKLDGSGAVTLVDTNGNSESIALDVAGNKMYWTHIFGPGTIKRANLDGTNIENIVTGLSLPSGVALDLINDKIYWTDKVKSNIRRANLNGSAIEDLVTTGLEYPAGIQLDLASGLMYWGDLKTNKIQRANLDGTNVTDLYSANLNAGVSSLGLAIDHDGGYIYWTQVSAIKRARLDGTGSPTVLVGGLGAARGLALDLTPIPEPSAFALLGTGSIALLFCAWRRRRLT